MKSTINLTQGAFNDRMFMKALKLVTYDNLITNPEGEIIKMIMIDTKQDLNVATKLFKAAVEFKFVDDRTK